MNILYVGPYRQQDGWGRASRDYLQALSLTGHNVAARPIWLSNHLTNSYDNLILELEDVVFSTRPDVIIQNVLPYYGDYQYGMKNILQLYLETYPLIHTTWPSQMAMFDKIWVPTYTEANMIESAPTNIIPMPIDFDRINPDIEPIHIKGIDDDDFIFYFIGEYVERKNLLALVLAFHREFRSTENARLVIKTNLGGVSPEQLFDGVESDIQNLYQRMRLYNKPFGYIKEQIITGHMSYDDILRLHKRCDCLVMPSRGESTCRPVIEALAMGNQAIVTANTGMADAALGLAYEVESHIVPVTCQNPPINNIYTANEVWQEIDIINLQFRMRQAYEAKESGISNAREALIKAYSYSTIAQYIEASLNDW